MTKLIIDGNISLDMGFFINVENISEVQEDKNLLVLKKLVNDISTGEEWQISRAKNYWSGAYAIHYRRGDEVIKLYATRSGALIEYTNNDVLFVEGIDAQKVVEKLYNEKKNEVVNGENSRVDEPSN